MTDETGALGSATKEVAKSVFAVITPDKKKYAAIALGGLALFLMLPVLAYLVPLLSTATLIAAIGLNVWYAQRLALQIAYGKNRTPYIHGPRERGAALTCMVGKENRQRMSRILAAREMKAIEAKTEIDQEKEARKWCEVCGVKLKGPTSTSMARRWSDNSRRCTGCGITKKEKCSYCERAFYDFELTGGTCDRCRENRRIRTEGQSCYRCGVQCASGTLSGAYCHKCADVKRSEDEPHGIAIMDFTGRVVDYCMSNEPPLPPKPSPVAHLPEPDCKPCMPDYDYCEPSWPESTPIGHAGHEYLSTYVHGCLRCIRAKVRAERLKQVEDELKDQRRYMARYQAMINRPYASYSVADSLRQCREKISELDAERERLIG